MFNGFAINKIERGRSSMESTGTRLESEFIGEVDSVKYKELAYAFLHKDKADNAATSEDGFKQMMLREAAQKEFENALDLANRSKYIDYKNSVRLVEQSQLGNPERPSRFFSGALYKKVKERFEDKYILKFFTATGGTHLDVVHGVDGFFKLYDKESGRELAMATIDLTGNSAKDTARADVLISVDQYDREKYDPSKDNENFDKNFFNQKIEKFSEMVVQALIENYQNR